MGQGVHRSETISGKKRYLHRSTRLSLDRDRNSFHPRARSRGRATGWHRIASMSRVVLTASLLGRQSPTQPIVLLFAWGGHRAQWWCGAAPRRALSRSRGCVHVHSVLICSDNLHLTVCPTKKIFLVCIFRLGMLFLFFSETWIGVSAALTFEIKEVGGREKLRHSW